MTSSAPFTKAGLGALAAEVEEGSRLRSPNAPRPLACWLERSGVGKRFCNFQYEGLASEELSEHQGASRHVRTAPSNLSAFNRLLFDPSNPQKPPAPILL